MKQSGKLLMLFIFISLFSLFTFGIVKTYLEDKSLSSNGKEIEATIDSKNVVTKRKKGVEITKYYFVYSFIVNGEKYKGNFEINDNESGEKFNQFDTISVIYSQSNPFKNKTKSTINTKESVTGIAWKIIKSFIITGLLSIIFGFILAHKFGMIEKTENNEENQPA